MGARLARAGRSCVIQLAVGGEPACSLDCWRGSGGAQCIGRKQHGRCKLFPRPVKDGGRSRWRRPGSKVAPIWKQERGHESYLQKLLVIVRWWEGRHDQCCLIRFVGLPTFHVRLEIGGRNDGLRCTRMTGWPIGRRLVRSRGGSEPNPRQPQIHQRLTTSVSTWLQVQHYVSTPSRKSDKIIKHDKHRRFNTDTILSR